MTISPAFASPPSEGSIQVPFGVRTPLQEGQSSQIWRMSADGAERELVLEVPFRLEAPNWAPDGSLVLNGGGKLFLLPQNGELREIPVDGIDDANNDHVLSHDGSTIYLSADGAIYAVPIGGGAPSRLSPDDGAYYLHGISPDGRMLACTVKDASRPEAPWGIRLVPAEGGAATTVIEGPQPVDGPEWSPDGAWIWFSGELAADYAGHAQIFRMRPDGTEVSRVIVSDTVDWFPHPSPDGQQVLFMSYPVGTLGHPPDRHVSLKMLDANSDTPRTLVELFGGQGTVNVNSWSPDSRRFAYVAFPLTETVSEAVWPT